MAEEILASVQVRRDNKANWEAVNPVLLDGEAAYEQDTDMFKIGDGVNNYKNLPYHNKVGPKGDTGATPQISMSVSTGAAGSEASVSVSGTAENPLINLTIPRGDTGASGVTEEADPTVPDWAKQPSKPTYTASEVGARPDSWTPSASDVGADAAGTASGAVAAHNTSGAAHADLRALIEGLTIRLNALADSDDTTLDQLSEIVAYIKSNKSLIDAVTTGKVSVSDIVDNLTTNASGKVLSAAQGVRLKSLIDAIVIPDKLPNPQPLTINGQSYDGSAKVEVTLTGEGGGANINDTTPSSTTTYSSQKIESELTALNQANAAQDTEIAKKANDADLAAVAKSGSYSDLSNKPTIPTVPSSLPNPNALAFTGAVNETYDGSAPKSVAIPTVPESLKNPNKLILSGAVTAEYDGSTEVSVEIPAGGGSAYELPIASATQLGGVKPVAKTDEMTQAVGVDAEGKLFTVSGSGSGAVSTSFEKIIDYTFESDEVAEITFTSDDYPLLEKVVDNLVIHFAHTATPNKYINATFSNGTSMSVTQNNASIDVGFLIGGKFFSSGSGTNSGYAAYSAAHAFSARTVNVNDATANIGKFDGGKTNPFPTKSIKLSSWGTGWAYTGDRLVVYGEVTTE